MKHRPDEAAVMVPCTADEWPFDDLHDDEKTGYAGCTQQDGKP